MTWAPLLLADPSPILRLRVLRDLLHRPPADPEVLELSALSLSDPFVQRLLGLQAADGSWRGGFTGDTSASTPILATALALMRLGYLGFGSEHPAVRRGAEYLFSQQRSDGAWPQPGEVEDEEDIPREGYAVRSLQTSLPLRGLAACRYAEDPRAALAYSWLLAQRLPDGAWPTGIAGATGPGGQGVYGGVAGYRRLPHSRWGCRSNTTGALACLALHPTLRTGPEARRALDLLLGRETREVSFAGCEVARLLGAEPFRGFLTFYARFDLAFLLDLCWRTGATLDDERVAGLVNFLTSLQGPYGLWEYAARPQISRWLTFDLLRSLSRLTADHSVPASSEHGAAARSEEGEAARGERSVADWLSLEPRTPFRAYPKKARRY